MPRDSSDLLHGTLDALVLKTLSWGPRHGYAVAEWIHETSKGELEIVDAALYKALHRLEDSGAAAPRTFAHTAARSPPGASRCTAPAKSPTNFARMSRTRCDRSLTPRGSRPRRRSFSRSASGRAPRCSGSCIASSSRPCHSP